MNRLLTIGSGLLFVLALSVPTSSVAVNVQFDAEASSDFTVPTNWADNNPPAADGDIHFIDNGLTADLTGTATVSHVVVGDVAAGTLNVNGGTLNLANIAGFPGLAVSSFFSNHTGLGTVNVTNGGTINMVTDNPGVAKRDAGFVGDRADGTLNIGAGSSVLSPDVIWRIGQFGGPYGDPPHEADGFVNVQGTWTADYMYLGPNGGDAEVNVSGNGSVFTTRAVDARAVGSMKPFHSSIIRMIGSNASWSSDDILLDRQGSGINQQARDHVMFISDAGGVSEMVSRDALLFNDAEVTVDLTSYGPLSSSQRMLLFDAAPGQLADGHVFGVLNVLGVSNPTGYRLAYDDVGTGNIYLELVPEPNSIALLVIGMLGMASRPRRNLS
jgi:PEP-CTERM motif